jgi:hypothetical protein
LLQVPSLPFEWMDAFTSPSLWQSIHGPTKIACLVDWRSRALSEVHSQERKCMMRKPRLNHSPILNIWPAWPMGHFFWESGTDLKNNVTTRKSLGPGICLYNFKYCTSS